MQTDQRMHALVQSLMLSHVHLQGMAEHEYLRLIPKQVWCQQQVIAVSRQSRHCDVHGITRVLRRCCWSLACYPVAFHLTLVQTYNVWCHAGAAASAVFDQ